MHKPWKLRLERERRARKEAEALIERRSLELYEANEKLRAEIKLREEAERHLRIYEEVVRSTGEAVVIARPDGIVVDANPAFERVTGYSRAEVIGTPLYREASTLNAGDAPHDLWEHVRTEGAWNGELLDRRKGGEVFPWWVTINVVRDARGEPLRIVSVSRDVTALKRSEEQLQKLAFYDPLTGLANRALLDDRLKMALTNAKRSSSMLSVMYIDLDRFKYVNDTLGHPAGDQLLIEISRRLAKPVRTSDTIARMGGDEFTILLTGLEAESNATRIAERIIDAVSRPVRLGDDTVFVGASIGISFYPRDGNDADALRKHADVALYEAKHAGRGQYRAFNPEMVVKAKERLSLSVEIDAALQENQFTLFYQPVVDVPTGQTEEVVAVVHWRRPDGELLPPEMFIPHAEEIGLIRRIDLWVLERACSEVAQWASTLGRVPRLSVKFSPITMQQSAISKEVKGILVRTGFSPQRLNLVLSEAAVIANRNAVSAVLGKMAALGVSISLDDFGTGYSSLGYLAKLPVQTLKIERSFILAMLKDPDTMTLVRTIISLAHSLKLKVVAEGVDSEEQARFLRLLGCDEMQGHLFSRPVPYEDMTALLKQAEPRQKQKGM